MKSHVSQKRGDQYTMTQDYEHEINLIDLLGYIICRWKWLVIGLILGGLIGGAILFCTP